VILPAAAGLEPVAAAFLRMAMFFSRFYRVQ
jgi:hypothetical protein